MTYIKTMSGLREKYFGDRKFYSKVLYVAVPIMVQNGITNFVSLLDNIMIGRVGTEQMSGAAIVNQLLFVYYLCLFGGMAGAGIFTAQFYGQGNEEGVRQTFRFKLFLSVVLTGLAVVLFLTMGDVLIGFYLRGEGTASQIQATLGYGRTYLGVMLLGLPAVMITNCYASTLRECGETVVPMRAGVTAVLVNLLFNYLLIYGKAGFPALGVKGAAIATVISRYVEVLIVVVWTHRHTERNRYIKGLYSSFRISPELMKSIIVKGSPLLINETLWSTAMSVLMQCLSVRGLNVVAAFNISTTLNNLFNIVYIALGDSVAILVGQLLGAGKMEEARDTDTKLITFSVMSCLGVALIMLMIAPFFPRLYNTNEEARYIASRFIIIAACCMPMNAFLHASYFTLRSGGRTVITFLFDSVYEWGVSVSLAFVLTRFTSLNVILIYAIISFSVILKCIVGYILVKKGVWLRNIVTET